MKNMTKLAVAAMLYAIALPPALAEGFYGAFDAGQTNLSDTCNGGLRGACNDSSTALRIAAGYQFVPMWGAEASYGTYGNATKSGIAGDWQTSGWQASGIGIFPVWENISVIGKVGLARTEYKLTASSRSATTSNLAFGIGAQFKFGEKISFRAQYEDLGTVGDASTTGTARLTLISAGVVWRFQAGCWKNGTARIMAEPFHFFCVDSGNCTTAGPLVSASLLQYDSLTVVARVETVNC